jgi:sterol carrier protein 2
VKASAFDYNPAVEARTPSKADVERVRSRKARSEYALGDTMRRLEARL